MIIRNVLSDQVKDYLLTAILAGEYPPRVSDLSKPGWRGTLA